MRADLTISERERTLWEDLPHYARVPRPRALAARPRETAWEAGVWLAEPERVLFLDIETTGLSRFYDYITVVGYQIGGRYSAFVRGDDDAHLRSALANATTLVTFNGTLFDLPFLRKEFDGLLLPPRHVDLRYASRRVGLSGGQKAIERALHLPVRMGVEDMDGASAVLLWHQYLRGDTDALRALIEYNLADIQGMCGILDHVQSSYGSSDLLFERHTFLGAGISRGGHASVDAVLPSPGRLGLSPPSFGSLFEGTAASDAVVVGIDLTGSEGKPSGVCTLRGSRAETEMIATDDDLVAAVVRANPALVSIDSPLSLPRGRRVVTDDDPGRQAYGILRQSERTLKRRGINVYPCLLPSMQKLTARGIALAERLRRLGYPVIESYPGAAQDIICIPRKGAGEHFLKLGLAEFGIRGAYEATAVKHDELDAITSALVGTFFLAGKFEALTGPDEGDLIIPDLNSKPRPVVIGISGRIAAGKTTAARIIERLGFRYARFSEVIDAEIVSRGLAPNRHLRQQVGWEIHIERGQRWLCERLIAQTAGADKIVIDGLRFPDDHIFFFEKFGPNFRHLHIDAPRDTRESRYAASDPSARFAELETQPTEGRIDALRDMAFTNLSNERTVPDLERTINSLVCGETLFEATACQSQSS